MKSCPQCHREYFDETLNFCLDDGEWLLEASGPDEPATAILTDAGLPGESPTRVIDPQTTEPPVSPTHSEIPANTPLRANKMAWMVGALAVAIVLASVFGYRYYSSANAKQIESIAVMPFQNRSDDPDTDYLSDGLAESLIFRLSQLPGLKVSPASSAIRYKGKETDIEKIGSELGVDAVVTGRLMKRGDNLNIMVELVDVRDNKSLWGEQYERKMSDLLATQREIAATIADKLQIKLVGDQAKGITKKYTNSNEAYQLYMRARHHFAKRTKADMLQAADLYRQAIGLDPNFALAYARLAEVYLNLPTYPYMSTDESLPQASAAVQKALELDPTLSEAHSFNGFNLAGYEHKWAEAESEFKRAIELDPNSSAAHFRYGQMYLAPMGRFDEANSEMKTALDMEPFDANMGGNYAWALLVAGQNDKALEMAKKTYDLEPTHPITQYYTTMVYNANGMYPEALAICENALKIDPTNQRILEQAGIAYARTGRRDKAEEVVKKFEEIGKTQFATPYRLAAVHVALGNRDEAFASLEKSYQVRDWWLIRLKVDPIWAPVRDDPRYKDLLKRLGLPQ